MKSTLVPPDGVMAYYCPECQTPVVADIRHDRAEVIVAALSQGDTWTYFGHVPSRKVAQRLGGCFKTNWRDLLPIGTSSVAHRFRSVPDGILGFALFYDGPVPS